MGSSSKFPSNLNFDMRCPFYTYDEVLDVEEECEGVVTVEWHPPQGAVYDHDARVVSPPWPAEWSVWGCGHVEEGELSTAMVMAIEEAILEELRREWDG